MRESYSVDREVTPAEKGAQFSIRSITYHSGGPMFDHSIKALIGMTVYQEQFRNEILNGQRAEHVGNLKLNPSLQAQILAIQAQEFSEFAAAVEEIIDSSNALAVA